MTLAPPPAAVQCSAGFGKHGKACSRCASSSCGVCAKDYKKCELKKTTCPKPDWTNWKPVGTKVAWNPAGYCRNPPGLATSTFTPTVVKDICLDCGSSNWHRNQRSIKFCDLRKQAEASAATAVQEDAVNSGCEHPAGIKLTLNSTCITHAASSTPFTATFLFFADVCGTNISVAVEHKGHAAAGGGKAVGKQSVSPTDQQEYATRVWDAGAVV